MLCELYDNDNTVDKYYKHYSSNNSLGIRIELTFAADTTGALDDDNALVLT